MLHNDVDILLQDDKKARFLSIEYKQCIHSKSLKYNILMNDSEISFFYDQLFSQVNKVL